MCLSSHSPQPYEPTRFEANWREYMSREIHFSRRNFLRTAAVTIAALLGIFGFAKIQLSKTTSEGEFPSLGGATGWLNSQPLTAASLRGKAVLIDFCTY